MLECSKTCIFIFLTPTFSQVIPSNPTTLMTPPPQDYSEISLYYIICSERWAANTNIQMTTWYLHKPWIKDSISHSSRKKEKQKLTSLIFFLYRGSLWSSSKFSNFWVPGPLYLRTPKGFFSCKSWLSIFIILETKTANIFSHYTACPFNLFTVSSAVQKLLRNNSSYSSTSKKKNSQKTDRRPKEIFVQRRLTDGKRYMKRCST